ncbi:hypothetical protein CJD36_009965 [Flavipsychrobacter stenotrophus]|uniref:Uncharacterized protein n=1 Tax=Flavipsychrobacter stenotrophus TaxID=2077091 RepID=A0A2S7SYS7_9BACT|nr:DUF4178 domain-containing protein [Flavipsychrobacter stenotrophus]PQJ12103.1 hypothetical protein CJD36_009965 [Flavipsychrobacter stenotrophus]
MADTNITSTTWHQKTVTCPTCASAITYYDLAKSKVFACPQCATLFEIWPDSEPFIRRIFSPDNKEIYTLPMGLETTFYDKPYKLVGHMFKKQANTAVYWNEYLFFSAGDNEYITMSEYDGHWLFITRIKDKERVYSSEMKHDRLTYSKDLSYKYDIVYATGEFDWNILDDEQLTAVEFVHKPMILIWENDDERSEWYKAIYRSPNDVLRLLPNLKKEQLAPRGGTITFNPATFYPRFKPLMIFTGILLAAFIMFHLFLSGTHTEKEVYKEFHTCTADTGAWTSCKPIITAPFKIEGPVPVGIRLDGLNIDNDWLELQIELINDKTGKVFEVDKTIEFYHGYEGGENWSEGDNRQEAIISGVPTGTYHLNIYPFNEKITNGATPSFSIAVFQNVFLTSNFFTMLMLIITYPLIQLIRKLSFEGSRWFTGADYNTNNDTE